jgi:hypothetical protein
LLDRKIARIRTSENSINEVGDPDSQLSKICGVRQDAAVGEEQPGTIGHSRKPSLNGEAGNARPYLGQSVDNTRL